MKITKTQLKEIIIEEIEQIDELDMYDIERGIDKGVQGALGLVGLSRKDKARRRKAKIRKMEQEYEDQMKMTPEKMAAYLASPEYKERKAREDEALRAMIKAGGDDREAVAAMIKRRQKRAELEDRAGESESEQSRRDRALAKGGAGYFSGDRGYGESIDRDKLARIIAEEIQKVLKNK